MVELGGSSTAPRDYQHQGATSNDRCIEFATGQGRTAASTPAAPCVPGRDSDHVVRVHGGSIEACQVGAE